MTGSHHHHDPKPPKDDDHCICFTPGSLIATVRGEVAVESLQEGDQIFTRDNGSQSIVWTGRKELTVEQVARKTDLIPVMIAKGALGNGLPERDLMVSPQHRVLLTSDRAALYFEDREVLTAAKHLVGLPGITRPALSDVTYIHFMCENHEVVLSNGAWTETFQPGNSSLGALEAGQRTEIFALFPELETQSGLKAYTSARKTLKKHEAQLLLAD